MGKISKLATVVAKAARMEKKASDYKGKVAELLNDINEPSPIMDYISESEAEEICKEIGIPHEASWYKGDLFGYIDEVPDGMVNVLIEHISEEDAEALWRRIAHDMGMDVDAKKQTKLHKKAKKFKINMEDTNITVNDTTDQFTEEEIKQAMAKENPTIYWSDDRNKHWFFDFPFEKDGKKYWISSQNITNDLKNIDIMVFEGNNKGSFHKTKLTKKAVRKYTNMLLDYMEQGILSPIDVAKACLSYMSEDDVQDMAESNDFIIEEEEEEEKEITDLDKETEIDLTLRMNKFKKIREELERKYNYKKNLDFFDNYDNEVTNKYEELGGTFEYDKEYDIIEIDKDILVKALQQLAEEEEEASE